VVEEKCGMLHALHGTVSRSASLHCSSLDVAIPVRTVEEKTLYKASVDAQVYGGCGGVLVHGYGRNIKGSVSVAGVAGFYLI